MKKLLTIATISLSLMIPSLPAFAGDSEIDKEETLENVMSEHGLFNRVNCTSGGNIIRVRMQGSQVKNQKTLCFQNNSEWESGSYVYNFDSDRLTHRGCEVRTENCFGNSSSETNVNISVSPNPYTPSTPNPYNPTPQPHYPPQPQPQPPAQTYFYSLSGAQVPPYVQSALRGVAAGQRLQIATCETNSAIHVIVNNSWGFCAFPNAQYPSGKWKINVQGLQ